MFCKLVLSELLLNEDVVVQHCPLVSPVCRYRAFTFVLTFLLYTCFHLSRKPISIVKVNTHIQSVQKHM